MLAVLFAWMIVAIVISVVVPIVATLHVNLPRRLPHDAAGNRWRASRNPQNHPIHTAHVSHGGASSLGPCIRRAHGAYRLVVATTPQAQALSVFVKWSM
jgi:hypothetical protein